MAFETTPHSHGKAGQRSLSGLLRQGVGMMRSLAGETVAMPPRQAGAEAAGPTAVRSAGTRAIHVFNAMPFWGRGHSETCYRICAPWAGMGQRTTVHTTICHRDDPAHVMRSAVPQMVPKRLKSNIHRFLGLDRLRTRSENDGLYDVRPGDICYFWPASSTAAIRKARDLGAIIFVEFINTHVAFADKVLAEERRRMGFPENADLGRLMREEEERLQLAHFVFAPGPFVGPSIREFSGAPVELLETSYGAYPPADPLPERTASDRTRFLFVGSTGMRKGLRTLLDAWERAGLDAELLIVGNAEPALLERVERMAARNVRRVGFLNSLSEAFLSTDVFVFPSLEEGDPQGTYEAAAHGMPLIVTPMGGGRVADETNAIMVGPSDAEALAAALARLDGDAALRQSMGAAARKAALQFDWNAVSRRRLDLLLDAAERAHPGR